MLQTQITIVNFEFNTRLMIINSSKIFLLFFLILSGIHLSAQEKTIDEWELPRTARDFIAHNFPEQKITQALRIEENGKKEFETVLDNQVKIEFDNLGYWTEVQSNNTVLPTEFIPKKIMEYLTTNHPKQKVNKIEKEQQTYEVELTDGTDYEFSLKGKFLRKKD